MKKAKDRSSLDIHLKNKNEKSGREKDRRALSAHVASFPWMAVDLKILFITLSS